MAQTKQNSRPHGGEKRKRDDEPGNVQSSKRQTTSRPEQTAYDESISMMDPTLLSDHFAKALRKHSSDSTSIELEDDYVSTRSIRDTTSFTKPHIAKNLPLYLETFAGGKKDLTHGDIAAPHTLILTPSGIRAADLARDLRTFSSSEKGDVKIAKLFAKHMKLAECVTFVQKTKINMAVGTPQRPRELIEKGVMKTTKLKRIIIDGSYVDEKKRTIFDLGELFMPLIQLLNMDGIKGRLGGDGKDAIEILVF